MKLLLNFNSFWKIDCLDKNLLQKSFHSSSKSFTDKIIHDFLVLHHWQILNYCSLIAYLRTRTRLPESWFALANFRSFIHIRPMLHSHNSLALLIIDWFPNECKIGLTLQKHLVYSMLKRLGNGRSHAASMWNTRGVFVGNMS